MDKLRHKDFEILDCTIRDGGYVNSWNFDVKMVKDVYRNISRTGVDIIELGFRNIQSENSSFGSWYSVNEALLEEIVKGTTGVLIALMLDYGKSDYENIPRAEKSLVDMYRVACHKDKAAKALEFCEEIKNKGYRTSLQLMGIISYSEEELEALLKPVEISSLDYVYFADSYGSLLPRDIIRYSNILKRTKKRIGFHAHNSLQLAFANTLEAISNGIDIVDGTVFGMGRGAGNLPLETLVAYLEKTMGHKKYNTMPILDLIDRYFGSLHKDYHWGYSLPYMLSGIFEVHPNYAKTMVNYNEYSMDDIVKVLEVVKDKAPVGFDKNIVEKVIKSGFITSVKLCDDPGHDGQEQEDLLKKYPVSYADKHKGKDFLILANGPSLKEHNAEILKFIQKYDPVIMGANYLGDLMKPHYHAFSNKKRFINYVDSVNRDSRLLLSTAFDDDFIRDHTNQQYERIVHLSRLSNVFNIKNGVITSNCRTVSILLIAVAIVMGAERIFIAGLDGYKSKENFISNETHFYKESDETENFKILMERHDWNESMLNSINTFLLSKDKEALHIITPTSHKYFYNSIQNWIK
ncbi:MAG: aldolase catalytic domain-containing protein [Candidatus Omnitrophota bacterium]